MTSGKKVGNHEKFLNSSDHPGAAHDEHHRDPHPPSVHLHHRLRHGDPRPVAQLHDPSAHEARGPRRRPCPRVFVPGAWFTFSAVPRASSRCAPRLTSPPRPAADRRAPRGRRGRARRQAAQVHGGVTARTRALFPGRAHELRRLSETKREEEAHTTFCSRKNIFFFEKNIQVPVLVRPSTPPPTSRRTRRNPPRRCPSARRHRRRRRTPPPRRAPPRARAPG